MTFAGINYVAVVIAGVVGFLLGGVWYRLLATPWKTAHGLTSERIRAHHGRGAPPWPLLVALAANLTMALMLAGLVGHLGTVDIRTGVISAAFVWFGFVFTSLAVNNVFAMRKPALIWIDGGHWLLVLVAMGAIIGVWGA
ncbi:MAG: DUF1761 domain-containing protein [Pseudolabrys sp.]|nr:DUF1761 domain-containing protein [Pseudolabrys sp.]